MSLFRSTVKDIKRIEKQNEININLFGYDKGAYPIRISETNFTDHLELLWIEEGDKSHYVLIKDFNRFMTSFNKHHGRKYFVSIVFIVAVLLEFWKFTEKIAYLLWNPSDKNA